VQVETETHLPVAGSTSKLAWHRLHVRGEEQSRQFERAEAQVAQLPDPVK